jgi:hypothetical protein
LKSSKFLLTDFRRSAAGGIMGLEELVVTCVLHDDGIGGRSIACLEGRVAGGSVDTGWGQDHLLDVHERVFEGRRLRMNGDLGGAIRRRHLNIDGSRHSAAWRLRGIGVGETDLRGWETGGIGTLGGRSILSEGLGGRTVEGELGLAF